MMRARSIATLAAASALLLGAPAPAVAAAKGPARATAQLDESRLGEIRAAISEQRLLDAAQLIDQATFAGVRDPRLRLLAGEVGLARGRPDLAIRDFAAAEADPATAAEALQGRGLALAQQGRGPEAVKALTQSVGLAPQGWRAWNALGVQYDRQKDWAAAEAAYEHALTASGGEAVVYNNRGYSRLLQSRLVEAAADLVAALNRKPDLAEARTNLRLVLSMQGEYVRSTTAGPQDDIAVLLNNAGFGAAMRGDYAEAEDLLARAIKARPQHYEKASENLKLVRSLRAQGKVAAE